MYSTALIESLGTPLIVPIILSVCFELSFEAWQPRQIQKVSFSWWKWARAEKVKNRPRRRQPGHTFVLTQNSFPFNELKGGYTDRQLRCTKDSMNWLEAFTDAVFAVIVSYGFVVCCLHRCERIVFNLNSRHLTNSFSHHRLLPRAANQPIINHVL